MLFFAALAAVTQIVAPTPLNAPRLEPSDFPEYLYSKKPGAWRVGYAATIAPDGSIVRCDVEATSGEAKLDKLTCALLLKRAKFAAAQSANGAASYGVFRATAVWTMGPQFLDDDADFQISVNQMPAGQKSPAFITVAYAVDTAGIASSCVGWSPVAVFPPSDPTLVQLGCGAFIKTFKATAARDSAGNVVPSVQNARISFTAN